MYRLPRHWYIHQHIHRYTRTSIKLHIIQLITCTCTFFEGSIFLYFSSPWACSSSKSPWCSVLSTNKQTHNTHTKNSSVNHRLCRYSLFSMIIINIGVKKHCQIISCLITSHLCSHTSIHFILYNWHIYWPHLTKTHSKCIVIFFFNFEFNEKLS